MLELLIEHHVLILTVLLGISESLALIPGFKSHGILVALITILKTLLKKPDAKVEVKSDADAK